MLLSTSTTPVFPTDLQVVGSRRISVAAGRGVRDLGVQPRRSTSDPQVKVPFP